MRTIKHVLFAVVIAGALGSAGCRATHASGPRSDNGALVATEAPPEPRDPMFEHKPGHIWVHGRWARMEGQWVWQPGYHERERPGEVYANGHWDRRNGRYEWTMGEWKPARAGSVFVPGYYAHRGAAYVWMQDAWEPERPDQLWIPGRWTVGADGTPTWDEGHWEQPAKVTSPAKATSPAKVTSRGR